MHVEARDRVLVLTLDRPEARNAIDATTTGEIEVALDAFEADPDLWVCVITHRGPVFCAGADLKAVASGGGRGIESAKHGFASICARVRTKPLIAALEGPALAGGFEIALACDCIVASANGWVTLARFVVLLTSPPAEPIPKRTELGPRDSSSRSTT